ncbi:MAG: MATE family efflux transporter [Lachnospiraceae bacterium]|nr:MATE family efflux transporter [Lachnospiraceae bacterium]
MATKAKNVINENTSLLSLTGPMFFELLLIICLNNIDTLMLGHYSVNAVGAVGNANQLMSLVILMFNIIATATSVVVAQYLGAKEHKKMNTIYTLAFGFNLVIGVLLSICLVLFKEPYMNLINVPDIMRADAAVYTNLVGGCLFLQACYNVMVQILRCNGYTKVGMYISLIVNVINICGNYLFLYGPLSGLNFGVKGVAISTVVARTVALLVALVVFFRKKIGRIAVRYIIPFPKRLLFKMINIGIPSAGENVSYSLYQLVLLSFINSMGNDAVNAKVFCQSLISFAIVFSNSAAMATQIITGHLVGAGKEEAAYKRVFQTLKISMPVTIGIAVINWLICPYTLRFFTDNESIIRVGCYIMFVDIFIEIGRCLNLTFVNSLKAAGDCMYPLIIGLITMWGFGVTVGYGLGIFFGLGVAGVFAGTACDEIIRGLIVMRHWTKRKWIGKKVVE